MLVVCRRFANRRLQNAGLWSVFWQEHLFPHCFGIFSLHSFPFHFFLSEHISTQLPENGDHSFIAAEMQASLLPKNSLPRLHKAQYRNRQYGRERMRDLHMGYPKLGVFWTLNQIKRKTCLEMFMNLKNKIKISLNFHGLKILAYKLCWNCRSKQVWALLVLWRVQTGIKIKRRCGLFLSEKPDIIYATPRCIALI